MRRIPLLFQRHRLAAQKHHQTICVRNFIPFGSKPAENEDEKGPHDELTLEEVKALIEMQQEAEEEMLQDDDEMKPWHILLEPAARAAWRTSDQAPPQYWMEKRDEVLSQSERTSKQLRRNQTRIQDTHRALQGRRERERKREKQQKKPRADSLMEKHDKEKDGSATSVHYKPDFTLATLKHRLLPNYAITKRVLQETQALLPNFKPKRILDFGVGVGSSSAAAMDVFGRGSIEWIHGIDPSKSMRECAEEILNDNESEGIPRITTDASLTTKSGKGSFDMALFTFTATEMPQIAATMAAAAVLWEKLAPNGVLIMVEPGTPDGFSNIRSVRSMLLDCCPTDVEASEDEDDEFHALLDQCHIIAPCTHHGECPMERHKHLLRPRVEGAEEYDAENDEGKDEEIEDAEWTEEQTRVAGMSQTDSFESAYCSFVHNIPGSPNNHKGDKLSYFVAQKRYADSNQGVPPIFPNLTNILAETYRSSNDRDPINHEIMLYEAVQAQDKFEEIEDADPLGLSIVVGDSNRHSFGRIIRAPLKRKGHILVDYCTGPSADGRTSDEDGDDEEDNNKGRIVRHRIGKASSSKIAPGQYSAARKARWGGFWPDIMDKIH